MHKNVQFIVRVFGLLCLSMSVVMANETSQANSLPAGQQLDKHADKQVVIENQVRQDSGGSAKQSLEQALHRELFTATAFAKRFLRDPKQTQAGAQAKQLLRELLANKTLPKAMRKAAQNNLAAVLIQQKAYAEAKRVLLKNLQEESWVATTLENLNQLYAFEAQQAYQEVFEKTPLQVPKGRLIEWSPALNSTNSSAQRKVPASISNRPVSDISQKLPLKVGE